MSDQRLEETVDMASVVGITGGFKPMTEEEIEARNAAYLRRALAENAMAKWKHYCPPDIQDNDFSHPDLQPWAPLHKKILEWTPGPKGILASGPTGRGKSRSIWHLMKRLGEEGKEIRYFTAARFFSELQAQVKYGRDEAYEWVNGYAKSPIVMIDDLGQEAVASTREDWARAWLFTFLDIRSGNKLPLFVTTNLTADQMAGGGDKADIRANPLIRRLLAVADPIRF